MKASARADKRRRLNNLAEEAETAARNNCSSDLYQLTRKIAGQRRNMTTIKDREGKRLVNEDEVFERWREHFEGVPDIPDIFIRTFKALYHQSSSCVTEGGRFSSWFEVKSGVRQGCPMSGFIFVLIMDWVMRHTNNRRRGLRWKLTSILEDLDYADDVALISSRFADLQ